MANKIPGVLTPCPPSKHCPICYARMVHSDKYYGKEKTEAQVAADVAAIQAALREVPSGQPA